MFSGVSNRVICIYLPFLLPSRDTAKSLRGRREPSSIAEVVDEGPTLRNFKHMTRFVTPDMFLLLSLVLLHSVSQTRAVSEMDQTTLRNESRPLPLPTSTSSVASDGASSSSLSFIPSAQSETTPSDARQPSSELHSSQTRRGRRGRVDHSSRLASTRPARLPATAAAAVPLFASAKVRGNVPFSYSSSRRRVLQEKLLKILEQQSNALARRLGAHGNSFGGDVDPPVPRRSLSSTTRHRHPSLAASHLPLCHPIPSRTALRGSSDS